VSSSGALQLIYDIASQENFTQKSLSRIISSVFCDNECPKTETGKFLIAFNERDLIAKVK